MSIELLTNEHMISFKNALNNASNSIKIISPFIGLNTSKIIVEFMKKNPNCDCTIITRFYTQDFLEGVSSLEGLKLLKQSNVKLYALKNLHSKLYIIDNNYGIVGSANFTMGGFKSNHELSLVIEDESELLNELNNYFCDLKENIESNGDWEILINKIEEEIELTDKLFKNRKDKTIKFTNNKKWGASITAKESDIQEQNIIEDYLRQDLMIDNDIAWLKFEGTGSDRWNNINKYAPHKLKSKGIYAAFFPRNPRGIESGKSIFISVLSYDEKGNAIPMIIGRAKSYGYNPNNIVYDIDKQNAMWIERYPYYIELYDIEVIDSEIVNGISLNTLIMQLGSDLYPTTIGKNIVQEDIKKRHHQKSHIIITSIAKKAINDKLDSLLNKYGKRTFD